MLPDFLVDLINKRNQEQPVVQEQEYAYIEIENLPLKKSEKTAPEDESERGVIIIELFE